jgi:hypothetical protein
MIASDPYGPAVHLSNEAFHSNDAVNGADVSYTIIPLFPAVLLTLISIILSPICNVDDEMYVIVPLTFKSPLMSVVPLMKAPDIVSAFVVVAPWLVTSCKLGVYDEDATYDAVVAKDAYDALKAYDAEVTLFTVIVDNVAPLLANNLT